MPSSSPGRAAGASAIARLSREWTTIYPPVYSYDIGSPRPCGSPTAPADPAIGRLGDFARVCAVRGDFPVKGPMGENQRHGVQPTVVGCVLLGDRRGRVGPRRLSTTAGRRRARVEQSDRRYRIQRCPFRRAFVLGGRVPPGTSRCCHGGAGLFVRHRVGLVCRPARRTELPAVRRSKQGRTRNHLCHARALRRVPAHDRRVGRNPRGVARRGVAGAVRHTCHHRSTMPVGEQLRAYAAAVPSGRCSGAPQGRWRAPSRRAFRNRCR